MKSARALALAGVLVVSCAASAGAGGQLSGGDLMRLFPGRFQAVINGAMVISINARRDGSLVGRIMGTSDTGRWAVRSGKLCINWTKWLKGRTNCSAVIEDAGWYRGNNVAFKRI
ncbi:MAG: hypothetical protein M3N38_05385 [Pseudomonadota bacterium]|nr:hypothetical protein [Pseudomonadota bacterium]